MQEKNCQCSNTLLFRKGHVQNDHTYFRLEGNFRSHSSLALQLGESHVTSELKTKDWSTQSKGEHCRMHES